MFYIRNLYVPLRTLFRHTPRTNFFRAHVNVPCILKPSLFIFVTRFIRSNLYQTKGRLLRFTDVHLRYQRYS